MNSTTYKVAMWGGDGGGGSGWVAIPRRKDVLGRKAIGFKMEKECSRR